jgi:hypothetical protein
MSDKEKILAAINKLAKLDPNLGENLTKLAELAEKNKFVYEQAVKQLKSL